MRLHQATVPSSLFVTNTDEMGRLGSDSPQKFLPHTASDIRGVNSWAAAVGLIETRIVLQPRLSLASVPPHPAGRPSRK